MKIIPIALAFAALSAAALFGFAGDAAGQTEECGIAWSHASDYDIAFDFPVEQLPERSLRGIYLYVSETEDFAQFSNENNGPEFGTIIVRYDETQADGLRFYRAGIWSMRNDVYTGCKQQGQYRVASP